MPPAGGGRTRAQQRKKKPKTPAAALYYQSQARDVARRSKPRPRPAPLRQVLRTAPRVTGPPQRRWQPSPSQLRSARAQGRAYESQGRAVRRAAKVQKTLGPGRAVPLRKGDRILHQRDIERAQRKQAVLRRGEEYASQGRAVEQRAQQLNKKTARVLAGENLHKVVKPTRGIYNKQDVAEYAALIDTRGLKEATKVLKTKKELESAASKARAVKVLDQLMRPGYASAGGARALVKGQGIKGAAKGISRGAQLKERYLYSDVLKEAGVKNKAVRGVLGFGLDVALDPTTYVTFGAGSVAGKGAVKASIRAGEKAAKVEARNLAPKVARGELTKAEMKRAVKAKGREVQRKHYALAERRGQTGGPKGVTVNVAGGKHVRKAIRRAGLESKRAPLAPLTRATLLPKQAAPLLTAPLRTTKLGRKAATKKATVGKALHTAGSELHAGVRPTDLTKRQHAGVKTLRREQRAESEAVTRRVTARANALLSRLSEHERDLVIDAIESNKIGSLAPKLPKGAKRPSYAERRKTLAGGRVPIARSQQTKRDPYRLLNIAEDLQGDLRYLNRVGRRSGLLAGQVGKKGRTRAEVELSAKATPVPKGASAEAKAQQQAAQKGIREVRERRFGEQGEAKGFFPRAREEDVNRPTGIFERMAEGAEQPKDIKSAGVQAGGAQRREFRKTRAGLRKGSEEERKIAEALTGDVRKTLTRYGTSVSRAGSLRNLNTRLVQQGSKLPRNLSKGDFEALKREGKSVYRVRRGVLEKVDDYAMANRASQSSRTQVALAQRAGKLDREQADLLAQAEKTKDKKQAAKLRVVADSKAREANALRKRIGVGGGGQYAILDDAVVREARHQTAPTTKRVAMGYDKAQAGFKTVALGTPGYLVRNVLGDAFNAAVNENPFKLARTLITKKAPPRQAQRALADLGKLEKANAVFERQLPKKLKTIKLTPGQAAALGTTKTEVPALQLALLAEKHGVIRQGRFLELMEEGGGQRFRGLSSWQNAVKRAEDSVRMTTFLGSLHKGMDPTEAAANATRIHFDYGDLTDIEKQGLRRLMPFYTFTSRNLPLQARALATRPGRYATVQKAREEGRKQADLPVGFEGSLNPYEARQLGLPFKVNGKVYTVSAAAPFTDLNDLTPGGGPVGPLTAPLQRVAEMTSPIPKTPVEMLANFSFFYRDQIQHEDEPLTRAPEWAVKLSKASPSFAKLVGFDPNYLPPEGTPGKGRKAGKGVPGWGRKADYVFRQAMPGPINPVIEAIGQGVKGKNARAMSEWQRRLAVFGPRVIEREPDRARLEEVYDRLDKIRPEIKRLRRIAHPTDSSASGGPVRISKEHPTKRFTKLTEEESKLEAEKTALLQKQRPGGFVGGEEVPVETKVAKALGTRKRLATRKPLAKRQRLATR